MKVLPFTHVFCIGKYFERFPMILFARQSFVPNGLLFRIINKVQVLHFHHVSKVSTVERHRIVDLDYLKVSEIIFDVGKDKLQKMVDEIKFAAQGTCRSPKLISTDELQQLYRSESRSQRLKYLLFLYKKEQLKIADATKRKNKKAEKEKMLELRKSNDSSPTYGIAVNSLLPRVRPCSMKRFYHQRLANAALFGRKFVLDLDYDKYMIEKEKKACVAQLKIIFSENRKNIDPFDLYFCNADPDSTCVQYLKRDVPNINDSFISVTKQNYLDIFPKENLVYLSPHAKETLKEYDSNAIYIVGAFVDTVKKQHLSLHKAESEGIKSYSLPLDDYILWGAGTKSLTINQAFEILLSLKNTSDWIKAFECIPTRKIRKLDPQQIEKYNLINKIFLTNTSSNTS